MSSILILPGSKHYPRNDCDLCDQDILYIAVYSIKAIDISTGRSVSSKMELSVCDKHAEKVVFEIEKHIKAPNKNLFLI